MDAADQFKNDDDQWSPRLVIALLLLSTMLQILLHLPMLSLPPLGQHAWRQTVGHAAARNYVEEDLRFFYPRADIRMFPEDNGIVYHELPLSSWLAAVTHRVSGVDLEMALHSFQLLFNLLAIVAAYALLRVLSYPRQQALFFSCLLTWSPLYFYYAPLLEPNMLGLSFFLLGCALFLQGWQAKRFALNYYAGVFFLLLAMLAKPTFLFFGLPLAFIVARDLWQRFSVKNFLIAMLSASFILACNALVLNHAAKLYRAATFERRVHTPIGPADFPNSFAEIWHNFSAAITTWFIEMNVNLAALPFFACGLYFFYKGRSWSVSTRQLFWLGWLLSFAVFTGFFIGRFGDHDYYITASLPLAALVSSYGAVYLWRQKHGTWLVPLLFVAIIVVAVHRGFGRWFRNPQVPETLRHQAEVINRYLPPGELVLVEGDPTPIVFLYYLQRKGFSIDTESRSLYKVPLQHFRWLVRYHQKERVHPELTEIFGLNLVGSVGEDFSIYRLHPR